MNELRKAAEMALKYFEDAYGLEDTEVAIKEALREALAQPEREWEELDVNDAMNLIAEHITDPSPKLRYEIYGLIAEADMLLQEKNT
jgi:hypothetical protein